MGKQPQATHKRLQDDRPRSHEDASWKKRVHDEDANTSGRDAKRRRSYSSERRQRRSSSHSAERVDEVSRCLWRNDQHGSARHSSRQQERNSPSDREQQPAELRHPTDWRNTERLRPCIDWHTITLDSFSSDIQNRPIQYQEETGMYLQIDLGNVSSSST